ncbi:MAG TPA: hypothetical protein VGC97_21850 [Pyrinomonadaceae bacterium]|jgi:hypothetical protein
MKNSILTIKSIVLISLVITVLSIVQVNAGTRQRQFSEWLSAQGASFNPVTCGASVFGWATPDLATFARADYSGKIASCITSHGGPAFNPEFSGTVTERDLPDGTAEILVIHHFAGTYAVARDNTQGGIATLGYGAAELFGHPELQSGLANGMMQVKFINPYPGAPLPDAASINLLSISARIRGEGPLRAAFGVTEGTPGKFLVSQTGLFNNPGQGNGVADGFPAELVRVFQAGN